MKHPGVIIASYWYLGSSTRVLEAVKDSPVGLEDVHQREVQFPRLGLCCRSFFQEANFRRPICLLTERN